MKKVKISDFGLSRRLMLDGENYTSEMRPNLKLPLAWYGIFILISGINKQKVPYVEQAYFEILSKIACKI